MQVPEKLRIPANLVNEQYDDRYFDVVNALDEAQQIYFQHNDLERRILLRAADVPRRPFLIGETGFGAGRVVAALAEFLEKSGLRGVDIEYHSVELHPMSAERMQDILQGFRERLGSGIDRLVDAYRTLDVSMPGWHCVSIPQAFGCMHLKLWIGEALEMVEALPVLCDAWFLDGHSPKKNPSIWRPELMAAIGQKTVQGGTCATFTVSVAVRRALEAAGFTLQKLPGCGGKKEVLQGTRT